MNNVEKIILEVGLKGDKAMMLRLTRKRKLWAYLLLLIFGGLGIHKAYLHNYGEMGAYIGLFLLSFIVPPIFVVVVLYWIYDLVSIPSQVAEYNLELARIIKGATNETKIIY